MKKYLLFLLFLFLLVKPSFTLSQENIEPEEPEELVAKYGITFPISELGNCTDYSSCRMYCEDPVNYTTCIDFAKSKGFYKEEVIEENTQLFEKAQAELGCNSINSCQAVCEQPSNYQKCHTFSQNYGVVGGYKDDPHGAEIIEKAQVVLGCNSPESCKNICEEESNRQKCSDFAKEIGLRGGEYQKGPGGCTSKETCQAFCSDPQNYQICSQYGGGSSGNFKGPGGCNSESSCREYCQSHPQECGYKGQENNMKRYNPQEMCNKTPSCSWIENNCQCGFYGESSEETKRKAEEYARFCRENPQRCGMGESGSFENTQKREEFENYCRENPDKCRYNDSGNYDPKTECTKYPGCSWTNNSCQCPDKSGVNTYPTTTYSTPSYSGGGTSNTQPTTANYPDLSSECTKYPGCSWTNNSCQCTNSGGYSGSSDSSSNNSTGGYSTDPATACGQTAGCSWNGSTCQCSGVQGVSIKETFLQKLLRFLRIL